jgi:hypothetical protein
MDKTMKRLTEKDVTFTLDVMEEQIPVRGNALASGDDVEDKRYEDEIIRRLENGDVWAWACVKVTAHWNDFYGDDSLGCCSYENEEQFKQPGGYYDDMKIAALNRLNEKVTQIRTQLALLDEK